MVRAGLNAIYLSGWQVAADANTAGQMYPDQSLYPVNSVPTVVKKINASLQRADIEKILGEGFLPQVPSTEMPAVQRRVGLQELGLPYAADAAMTRHLARFLRHEAIVGAFTEGRR